VDRDRLAAQLEQNLGRQLSWIVAADTKSSFVFGAATAMLGLLAAVAPAYGKWTPVGITWSVVAAAPLLASLASLTAAVFPRTSGPKLSNIFFGSISARSVDAFRTDLFVSDEDSYVEDLVQQVHINAQIATAKFTWVRRATACLFFGVAPWAIATYDLLRDRG
jgi:hypothetical protein